MNKFAIDLAPTYPPLVFLFKDVGGVKIERRRGSLVGTSELRVATIADCQLGQPAVHNQVDDNSAAKNAVGDQVEAEPVERGADERADDDDREADLRVEVL